MSHPPAISVVMGAYNAQRYVAEQVESLLAQTFTDFECIVVDDGSTDETLSILRRLEKKDPRVKVIANPHGGIVDAANTGVGAARGGLIARAGADGITRPHPLRKQGPHPAQPPRVRGGRVA